MPPPAVIVFDVNETLSDLSPMQQRFRDVGAPELLARLWFAALLRDGFALAAAGDARPFAQIARGVLRGLLAGLDLQREPEQAVQHVLDGFGALPVHEDVPGGVRALADAGFRLVTLTNGSVDISGQLLARAGLRDRFERLLSVTDAGIWKPARGAYRYAEQQCGVAGKDLLLVAVHPWDIDGASRAGWQTAWLNRSGADYPDHMTAPTYTLASLTDLEVQL